MEGSKIEWTDHTFNPWWGCMKVSPGCKNCYAEKLDNRYNHDDPHWGPDSDRKPMSDKYWLQPLKWNKDAAAAGVNAKVFTASMADVFEDHPQVIEWRLRLFDIIEKTPHLTWLILTKRPENINRLIPESWKELGWPSNVWMGTSVENQQYIDRVRLLADTGAKIKFLSCEPLLGPIDLTEYYFKNRHGLYPFSYISEKNRTKLLDLVNWVIVGGESGPGARPMHPDWAQSLQMQCKTAKVSFFFKQWGEYLPKCQAEYQPEIGFFHDTLHPFDSPNNPEKTNWYYKPGKKDSGSLLYGKEYKEFPL